MYPIIPGDTFNGAFQPIQTKPFYNPDRPGMAATGIPKLNNTSKNADNILSATKYCQC